MAEIDAIKDVLRRDALSHGPWALRILDEIERLEAEVERLWRIDQDIQHERLAKIEAIDTAFRAGNEALVKAISETADEIVALRGALQALVDATDPDDPEYYATQDARAAAVALLAGPDD